MGGLAGQGQRDLFLTLFGAQPAAAGAVAAGRRARRSPSAGPRTRSGPASASPTCPRTARPRAVPATVHPGQHRAGHALARRSSCGFVDRAAERTAVASIAAQLRIGGGRATSQAVGTLSGGNQQKVRHGPLAAHRRADVLLLFDVTRGRRRGHQARHLRAGRRARRPGQGDPVPLQRDRGDRQPLPPRPRAARGPDRGRAPRSGRRRGAHRRRVHQGGARCVTWSSGDSSPRLGRACSPPPR